MKKYLLPYLMITPLVAGCIIFYAAPFLLVIRYSLSANSSLRFVGLDSINF